jgi:ribonucleoside-diphosphate reductase alpha chain
MSFDTTTEESHAAKNSPQREYLKLNSSINFYDAEGKIQFEKDKEATRSYFLDHVNQNTVFFHTLEEKLDYLVKNDYYENEFLDKYDMAFIKRLFQRAYKAKFRFQSFVGAYKYYTSYTLKTFDGKRYLERFEDRVAVNALWLANGDEELAKNYVDEIISGRYQPATPTFLNAGKKQRGEMVSCFLIGIEDDLHSIGRAVNSALQLSKRGGGVAFSLTDIRESGAPIKKIENQSSGVIPVMKMLEDAFSYANQLGARQGAGAVYLHAHHPDIINFLDSRRENADEKIRIKTLSLGVVIPDITFELAKNDEFMYLFSPYDVLNETGKTLSDTDVTKDYKSLVDNGNIRKKKIKARELLQAIAEVQFQSGYPYIMFADNVNRQNPIDGTIKMSNLCSEILQVQEPSVINADQSYKTLGKDISCNLGSLNIAKAIDSPNFGKTIETAIRALTHVSDVSDIEVVPTIQSGNQRSHAVGLGAMNLHGALALNRIHYGSEEGLDFTNFYFYSVAYYAIKASMQIAKERNSTFDGFERSKYADGSFFDKYTEVEWKPATDKVAKVLRKINVPTQDDWKQLRKDVMKFGLYNQNLQAIAPTGSISYINNSSSSILPITAQVENRKEGKLGLVFYPAPHMTNDNREFYQDAYAIGNKKIVDTYAIAQQHIDQGMSLTTFFSEKATTRDLNKVQRYAWTKGIKTLYYVRIKTDSLDGTGADEGCVSCAV